MNYSIKELEYIIDILNNKGSTVAIKTDTVYGIICNADDENAVKNIYEIKNRDANKAISIFIKSKYELDIFTNVCDLTDEQTKLIDKYWPGALTIIVKNNSNKYDYITKGKNTIGIRIPNDESLIYILKNVSFPLAQTSCNLQGHEPLRNINEINKFFKNKITYIADGGDVINNEPSTIVDFSNGGISLLRKGSIDIYET